MSTPQKDLRAWTTRDSAELYQLSAWGGDSFSINVRGELVVQPEGEGGPRFSLPELVEDLRNRDIELPMLLRISDILQRRVADLAGTFAKAIADCDYEGRYRPVFPIKVNQQRDVVEELVDFGRDYSLGLEAGSKPELLVVLAHMTNPDGLVICNGYKDVNYIETAMLAQKMGLYTIIVVDRYEELETIIEVSKRFELRPHIGVRARLASRGAGKWQESGGEKSKFGLTAGEMVRVTERLAELDMLDCLELLHFHIGSQITAIRAIKDALKEASRIFAELHDLGAGLKFLDVGGGLAVDYDGSQTNFHSSANYTLQEYANDVVFAVQAGVRGQGHPAPGHRQRVRPRADGAPRGAGVRRARRLAPGGRDPRGRRRPREHHHRQPGAGAAGHLAEERAGVLPRRARAQGRGDQPVQPRLPGPARPRARGDVVLGHLRPRPADREHARLRAEELQGLERALADTYYCNFSLFQSAPDHWAVKQLFPTMPIHRLNERPVRRAVLADLTCDSDGKVDRFIDLRDVKNVLEVHPIKPGEPYYIAMFLVGAYQEILGDLHNLFGDTNAIHISMDAQHGYRVERVIEGDTVTEVLGYVQYEKQELMRRMRRRLEQAVRDGKLDMRTSALLMRRYEEGLASYTYLVDDDAVIGVRESSYDPAPPEKPAATGQEPPSLSPG